jgi:hypothetical protein
VCWMRTSDPFRVSRGTPATSTATRTSTAARSTDRVIGPQRLMPVSAADGTRSSGASIGSALGYSSSAFELFWAVSERFELARRPATTFGLGLAGFAQPTSGRP